MIRIIAAAGLAASFAAGAADIQKCADGSGRVTYQDFPCAQGTAVATLPREVAGADPVALQRLDRERARLERSADAQIARQRQQEAAPAQAMSQPLVITTVGQQDGAPVYYAAPLGSNPGAGVIVGATGAVQDVQGVALQPQQVGSARSGAPTTAASPPASAVMPSPQGVMAAPGITASPGSAAPTR